jgi:hypothetical protein
VLCLPLAAAGTELPPPLEKKSTVDGDTSLTPDKQGTRTAQTAHTRHSEQAIASAMPVREPHAQAFAHSVSVESDFATGVPLLLPRAHAAWNSLRSRWRRDGRPMTKQRRMKKESAQVEWAWPLLQRLL